MPPNPSALTLEEFSELAQEAARQLPEEIVAMMENVALTVAEYPTPEQRAAANLRPGFELYGLYQGVPQTQRGRGYGMVPPDRITIFMYPMVFHFRTVAEVRDQVRRTLLHEIGHHFGLGEQKLRKLGY
ncbi:MAG: metallopeptidase family protein [Chloroflexi bacterium]|nr:metallopeptidase family protein [Chloroflexota bacterium]